MTLTLSLSGQELRRMLRPVLPHASLDTVWTGHPILGKIRFEVTGGTLYVMATDRRTLGVRQHTLQVPSADFAVQVQALEMQSAFSDVRVRDQIELELSEEGLMLRRRPRQGRPLIYRLRAAGEPDEFPTWRTMLEPDEQTQDVVFPSYQLARFADAADPGELVVIQPRRGGGWRIAVGDHFVGIAGGVRGTDLTRAFEEWEAR